MTPDERERQRLENRLKNERRRRTKQASGTSYAKAGRELRRAFGGAFGKAPAKTFNVCAEGTTAVRKPETELDQAS